MQDSNKVIKAQLVGNKLEAQKPVNEIIKLINSTSQLSLGEILRKRYNHNTKGWIDMKISDEALEMAIRDAVVIIEGRKRHVVKSKLTNYNVNHWALDRIMFIARKEGGYRVQYFAGQDYPYELQQLRTYLYKL